MEGARRMKEVGVGALFVFVKPKSVEDMKAKAWEGCTMAVVLTSGSIQKAVLAVCCL